MRSNEKVVRHVEGLGGYPDVKYEMLNLLCKGYEILQVFGLVLASPASAARYL